MELYKENIFHTKCHVNNKACNAIINGGSYTNIASITLVKKLGLPMIKHLRSLIYNGWMIVNKKG